MSYAGEYSADEYPAGIHGPRYGYAGSKAVAERDEEIAQLKEQVEYWKTRTKRLKNQLKKARETNG